MLDYSAFQFNYGKVGVRVSEDGSKKIYMAKNGRYGGNSDIVNFFDFIFKICVLRVEIL